MRIRRRSNANWSARIIWPAMAVSAMVFMGACFDGPESPGDKREWLILQSIEYDNRTRILQSIEFRNVDGYELMAVPHEGDSHPIWVMLKPRHGTLYKQMPPGEFAIADAQFAELVRRSAATPTVEKALKAHVRQVPQ